MRFLVLIIVLHTSAATLNVQKLKDNASMKLQTLQDTAALTIQHIKYNIDLEKVQKYDILKVLPKIEYSGKLLEEKVPEYAEKIKEYLKVLKSLNAKDLLLAFDGSAPYAAMRRMDRSDLPYYYEHMNTEQRY